MFLPVGITSETDLLRREDPGRSSAGSMLSELSDWEGWRDLNFRG